MVDLGWLGYRTANVCIRTLELSSISNNPPLSGNHLVIENLSHVHLLSIQIYRTRGAFTSLRAHSFQPFPLDEDAYRLVWFLEKNLNGSRKSCPLELHLMPPPSYCLWNHEEVKIVCSPKSRDYSIWTVSKDQSSATPLHRCSGAHVWSDWRQRIEGKGLPRRAKNVYVLPTGGIVTYVTAEGIVVRYYT